MTEMTPEEARAFVADLDAENIGAVFYAMREKFGITYAYWTRSDVDELLERECTDEEWERISSSKTWRDALPDTEGSTEILYQLFLELDIECEDELRDRDIAYREGEPT